MECQEIELAAQENMVPVTILTGFLGSGKTTLVNRILKEQHGHRIAVIENEFGEAGVDNEILLSEGGEQIIEMNNGCVCCTVRGDLIRILGELRERRDSGKLKFERVIIETTGLADPGPVAQSFFIDEKIGNYYLLDSVITLVDDEHVSSFAFRSDKAFDSAKLEEFLSGVVQIYGPDMLRYKGVLYMKGNTHRVVFQGVHMLMGGDLGRAWGKDEKRSSTMVFIGKTLREHELEADPTDQATIEEEYALELRARDRERKLLKKIDEALRRIEEGSYGYCEETGDPIGIPRLIARPTATLTIEAQSRREQKQKLYGE